MNLVDLKELHPKKNSNKIISGNKADSFSLTQYQNDLEMIIIKLDKGQYIDDTELYILQAGASSYPVFQSLTRQMLKQMHNFDYPSAALTANQIIHTISDDDQNLQKAQTNV